MRDDEDELVQLLGPMITRKVTDAAARLFLEDLKAQPDPNPATLQLIADLEEAWRLAAGPDMAHRK